MQRSRLTLLCVVLLCWGTGFAHSETCSDAPHPRFRISVDAGLAPQPVSGRLLVIMSTTMGSGNRLTPTYGPEAHSVWVAAKEVSALTAQQPVTFDPDELAYPEPFCHAPAGTYHIKAVLDINHDFAYDYDATPGDLLSEAVEIHLIRRRLM